MIIVTTQLGSKPWLSAVLCPRASGHIGGRSGRAAVVRLSAGSSASYLLHKSPSFGRRSALHESRVTTHESLHFCPTMLPS